MLFACGRWKNLPFRAKNPENGARERKNKQICAKILENSAGRRKILPFRAKNPSNGAGDKK